MTAPTADPASIVERLRSPLGSLIEHRNAAADLIETLTAERDAYRDRCTPPGDVTVIDIGRWVQGIRAKQTLLANIEGTDVGSSLWGAALIANAYLPTETT